MPIFTVVAAVILLDQATKFFILKKLSLYHSVPVIDGFFHLTLVYNRGAAFGIFKGGVWFFVLAACLAVAGIMFYLRSRKGALEFSSSFALSLIMGGAIGNLVDRLRFGVVIDFLDFKIWPVFNIADSAITCGVAIILFSLLREKKSIA